MLWIYPTKKLNKIVLLFLIVTSISLQSNAQTDTTQAKMLNLVDKIEADTALNLNYLQYERYKIKSTSQKDSLKENDIQFLAKNAGAWLSYDRVQEISDYLYARENLNFSTVELTQESNQVIQAFNDLRGLVLLLKFVQDHNFSNDAHKQLVRKKLIHAISIQMQIIANNTQAWYNYNTVEKKWLKGFQFESANDLFKFGLYQKNNDMDYTGMVKFSFITDMFKLDAGIPTQSYQAITYGGEVFTPFFRDTTIFVKEDTFNIYDRPHGCFQYVGFENHGISKFYKSRWTTNIRAGIIGGRFGYNFQFWLHRDISISPYPTGWDGQIAFPGRLALQANVKYERLILTKQANYNGVGFKLVPSFSGELAVGHYMTYGEIGLSVSTRNFKHKNRNNVLPKTQYNSKSERIRRIRLFGDLDFSARYVVHNTMLEGFGIFCTNEKEKMSFASSSIYTLDKDRVNPVVFFGSAIGGIQFLNINLFYRYSLKSPEYKSAGLIYTNDGKALDPNKRWHHYGTIGATFIF